jgi:octaprenyl-diphosphate synthase
MQIKKAFELIGDELTQVEGDIKSNLSSNVQLISKVGEYIWNSGGKRFRPMILLLSSRLVKYSGTQHISLAVVVEYIHTATLLHDDVVDNAVLRRGTASANSVWGNGSSVLVGDYLLAKAFSIAVSGGNIELMQVLSSATTRMAEGEVLQLLRHSDIDMTEEDYMEIITGKTAVLFSAASHAPAILADLSEEKKQAMAGYGMELGIAFQLIDDCLDYISEDKALGKTPGNDLKEGKVTLPIIKACRDSTPEERAVIEAAMGNDPSTEEIEQVLAIIKKYGGIEYALKEARLRIKNAKAHLELFPDDDTRAALSTVADFVLERSN